MAGETQHLGLWQLIGQTCARGAGFVATAGRLVSLVDHPEVASFMRILDGDAIRTERLIIRNDVVVEIAPDLASAMDRCDELNAGL